MLRGKALSEAHNPLNVHQSNGVFCPRVEIKLSGMPRAETLWYPACTSALIAKELSVGCRERLKVSSEPLLRGLLPFLQDLENAYLLLIYSKHWLGYTVSKCLGQIWKIRDPSGRNGWPFIRACKDMKKRHRIKNKSRIISRQRQSQERGPGPPPYPEHPSALASCPLNQSHCLALMQTLASLWFCREAAPHAPLSTRLGLLWAYPMELWLRQPARRASIQGGASRFLLIYYTRAAR